MIPAFVSVSCGFSPLNICTMWCYLNLISTVIYFEQSAKVSMLISLISDLIYFSRPDSALSVPELFLPSAAIKALEYEMKQHHKRLTWTPQSAGQRDTRWYPSLALWPSGHPAALADKQCQQFGPSRPGNCEQGNMTPGQKLKGKPVRSRDNEFCERIFLLQQIYRKYFEMLSLCFYPLVYRLRWTTDLWVH